MGDSNGDIYFADYSRVIKVDLTTGLRTVIAGSANTGSTNGVGTDATFNYITGMFVSESLVYLADYSNDLVRSITLPGRVVSTFAGGGSSNANLGLLAVNTRLVSPNDVAVRNGEVYIAEYFPNKIRKIDANGFISTYAGDGSSSNSDGPRTSAQLLQPAFIDFDSTGRLIFTSVGEDFSLLRMVDEEGIVSTIAGQGSATAAYDTALFGAQLKFGFIDSQFVDETGDVFVSAQNRIIRLNDVTTDAPSTSPSLVPTAIPSFVPSPSPSLVPSLVPTTIPSLVPSIVPSSSPSDTPSAVLSSNPTTIPSGVPSPSPSLMPSRIPTAVPTYTSTVVPSVKPSLAPTPVVPQYVWDIAGSGVNGFNGDNVKASSAQFSAPFDLWVDSTDGGIMYIADSGNQLIRTLDPVTGLVGVYAGTGDLGFQGDGAVATFAKFRYPRGVTGDGVNSLYVADTFNNRVRLIAQETTVISTIAGGGTDTSNSVTAATSAKLFGVSGLHYDQANDFLYFCDGRNHVVRRLKTIDRSLTVIAGTKGIAGFSGDGAPATDATMNFPWGLTLDTSGSIFVVEGNNYCVRKIDTAGIISTFAGVCGSTGYAGDEGPATDALFSRPRGIKSDSTSKLYITDTENHCIRIINTNTNIITTVVGTGNPLYNGNGLLATLSNIRAPVGLFLSEQNDIIFTEGGNGNNIRGVLSTGPTVSPSVAPTPVGFVSPTSAATATPSASPTTTIKNVYLIAGDGVEGSRGDGGDAALASLSTPYGVWLCQNGDILIADNKNHRIRLVDAATNIISTYAGNGVKAFSGDEGPATSASMKFPRQVMEYVPGTVLISDCFSHRIRRVVSGTIDTYVGGGTDQTATNRADVRLRVPLGMFIDDFSDISNHQLYFVEALANVVRKLDMNSGFLTIMAGTLDTAGTVSDLQATAAQLSFPFGVYLDSTGVMYVSERDNSAVRMIAIDGILTTYAGTVGVSGYAGDGLNKADALFSLPRGLWGDTAGNVYVSDSGNNRIRKIRPDGIIVTEVGTGLSVFNGNGLLASETNLRSPAGLYVTPGGEIYFVEASAMTVRAALSA